MTIGTGKSLGNVLKILFNAFGPPVEEPMQTRLMAFVDVVGEFIASVLSGGSDLMISFLSAA